MLLLLVLSTIVTVGSSAPLKKYDDPKFVMKVGKDMLLDGRSLVINATFNASHVYKDSDFSISPSFFLISLESEGTEIGGIGIINTGSALERLRLQFWISNGTNVTGEGENYAPENPNTLIRFRFAAGVFSCWIDQSLLYNASMSLETWTGIHTIRIKGHVQVDEVAAHGNVYPQNFETRFIGGQKEGQWIRAYFTFPEIGQESNVTLSLQNQKKPYSFNVTANFNVKEGQLLWKSRPTSTFKNLPQFFKPKDLFWVVLKFEKDHILWFVGLGKSDKIFPPPAEYNFDVLKITGNAELLQIERLDLDHNSCFRVVSPCDGAPGQKTTSSNAGAVASAQGLGF